MASHIEEVSILEEDKGKETGGHFRAEKLEVAVGAAVGDYSSDESWPTDRGLLAAEVDVASDWVGDEVSLIAAPDTVIGSLTAQSAAGATVHDVAQSVIDNIAVGFMVEIDGEALGECVNVDADNLQITTENGLTAAAAAGKTVKMSICMANRVPMTAAIAKAVGESKIGASHLPAGTVIRTIYHNLTGGSARDFKMTMETLY